MIASGEGISPHQKCTRHIMMFISKKTNNSTYQTVYMLDEHHRSYTRYVFTLEGGALVRTEWKRCMRLSDEELAENYD